METLVNEVILRPEENCRLEIKIFLGERQRFDSECFVGSASSSPAPKRPNVLIRQDRVPSVTDRSVTNRGKKAKYKSYCTVYIESSGVPFPHGYLTRILYRADYMADGHPYKFASQGIAS